MWSRRHDPMTGLRDVIDGAPAGGPLFDASLHIDADAICPRCLAWIAPHHFVRRTIVGLMEHESCP